MVGAGQLAPPAARRGRAEPCPAPIALSSLTPCICSRERHAACQHRRQAHGRTRANFGFFAPRFFSLSLSFSPFLPFPPLFRSSSLSCALSVHTLLPPLRTSREKRRSLLWPSTEGFQCFALLWARKRGPLSHKDVQMRGAECTNGVQELKVSYFSANPGAR